MIATCLVGCETAHDIGRTLTAPVRYVLNEPEPTAAANTSDVTNPGQPVVVPSPKPRARVASRKSNQPSANTPSRVGASKPSPSSQKSASATQFPVAKAVPGRPGLVFNPFNTSGAYIDVSGYAPGSKVKDPDSKQIFVVP
jgi:LysM repeat protein